MKTYFASPERLTRKVLTDEVETVSNDVVVSGLLKSISGLLVILNSNRQIVSINDSLLKKLGIQDSDKILGLRLGESLNCVHANQNPAGCGTSKFCSSCGAAIAIASALADGKDSEQFCAIETAPEHNNVDNNIALLVKAHPLQVKDKNFVLIFNFTKRPIIDLCNPDTTT